MKWQCWDNAGPASQEMDQHYASIVSMFGVHTFNDQGSLASPTINPSSANNAIIIYPFHFQTTKFEREISIKCTTLAYILLKLNIC